jgi:Bacterial DNA-binding protein
MQVSRVGKPEVAKRLAKRMGTDERTATAWVDALTDTLYEAFKAEESVTLPGFGSFYVRSERSSWVFKFSPAQKLRALFGWSSTYTGNL